MRGHLAQKVRCATVLYRARDGREVERALPLLRGKRLNEVFGQGIELAGVRGQNAPLDLLFKPDQLERRRLVQRGRRVVVGLDQFRRAMAVIAEVKAPIQMRLPR
ncbi:hypothetical protein D3C78_1707980 [compost metagenome]